MIVVALSRSIPKLYPYIIIYFQEAVRLDWSIVQVNLSQNGEYTVTASQEPKVEKGKPGLSRLTEDEYWGRMRDRAPECVEPASQVFEYWESECEKVYDEWKIG
jgi:hypothetical protein